MRASQAELTVKMGAGQPKMEADHDSLAVSVADVWDTRREMMAGQVR